MKALLLAALAASMASGVAGADHTIKLFSAEGKYRMDPSFLKVAPGDTVIFAANEEHDSDSIDGAIPEGAERWNGKMDEEVRVTLTVEGFYAYKCSPHYFDGMVGLIQVGESTANAEAIMALKMPPNATARLEELFGLAAAD